MYFQKVPKVSKGVKRVQKVQKVAKSAKKGHYISVSYIPENLQNIIIPKSKELRR